MRISKGIEYWPAWWRVPLVSILDNVPTCRFSAGKGLADELRRRLLRIIR